MHASVGICDMCVKYEILKYAEMPRQREASSGCPAVRVLICIYLICLMPEHIISAYVILVPKWARSVGIVRILGLRTYGG